MKSQRSLGKGQLEEELGRKTKGIGWVVMGGGIGVGDQEEDKR